MKQKQKDLLLKDLCARLPYKVKINIPDIWNSTKTNIEVLKEIFCGDDSKYRCNDSGMLIDYCKPYLFPLSSMTEEQKDIYGKLWWNTRGLNMAMHAIYWCNKNHFDYRGLIKKGLAIDATGKNIY